MLDNNAGEETMGIKLNDKMIKDLEELVLKNISVDQAIVLVLEQYTSKYIRTVKQAQTTARNARNRYDKKEIKKETQTDLRLRQMIQNKNEGNIKNV